MRYSMGLVSAFTAVIAWKLFGPAFNRWWSGRSDRHTEKMEREALNV